MSKQKEMIYKVVASTMTHPTADWIYQEARKRMPRISLGTVYRNLKALTEEGRVLEIINTRGPSRYDANVSPHSHLRCQKCGKMEDFSQKALEIHTKSHDFRGFQISEYRIELIGLCPDCQQRKNFSLRRKYNGETAEGN